MGISTLYKTDDSKLNGDKMKKKILFIMHDMKLAGTEIALLGMLKHIDYSCYEVTLLLIEYTGELLSELPNSVIVKVMNRKKRCYFKSVRYSLDLRHFIQAPADSCWRIYCSVKRKILKKNRAGYDIWKDFLIRIPELKDSYDIAVDYDGFCNRYLIKKVKSVKKVIWNHFNYEHVMWDYENDKIYYEEADYIVSVSNEAAQMFKRYFENIKEKILCLYNIMDIDRIKKLSIEPVYDCPQLQQENILKLCSVGRLNAQKDFKLALGTARKLKEKSINFIWIIIGEGEERYELEKLIRIYDLKNLVYLLGMKRNPYPYMKKCDIYIQTSKSEGLCITVGEAKVLKKPIIVTDIQGLREHIENGKNGLIIERKSKKIAQAIIELDEETRRQFSERLSKIDWTQNDTIHKFYNMMENEGMDKI